MNFILIKYLNFSTYSSIEYLLDSFISLKTVETTNININEVEFTNFCNKMHTQWKIVAEAIGGRIPCHFIESTVLSEE